MTAEMETAVKYQSHLPALLACIAASDGPVLELGIGHFSTPHLHAVCGVIGRQLISIEESEEWFAPFSKLATQAHFMLNREYFGALLTLQMTGWDSFGVGFIDHSPGGESRARAFKYLITCSEFVVVHDAQKDAENFQHIEPMLVELNWHLCTSIFPHTLVASKTRQIPEVLKGM